MNNAVHFVYTDERFADLQMLRYRLDGFDRLSASQRKYVYCLAKAALYGRDITFDQQGKYNLRVRKTLEAVWENYAGHRSSEDFLSLEVYLKRVWFSSGIYHHYGCEKFLPACSETFMRQAILSTDKALLPLAAGQTPEELADELLPVMYREDILPKRVNKREGDDLVRTSACNFYENVTEQEAEAYYARLKAAEGDCPPSWGLNSKLVKDDSGIHEIVWKEDGLYGAAISKITEWLERSLVFAENDAQRDVTRKLIQYYRTGDLRRF